MIHPACTYNNRTEDRKTERCTLQGEEDISLQTSAYAMLPPKMQMRTAPHQGHNHA